MNIHFSEIEAFLSLKEVSVFYIEIGSKMYGTANENSDKDILYVYIPCLEELTSFVETHHQFQYKEENTDYLFVNIFQFFRNALNGDSTINFEVIHHKSLKKTIFSWVYEHRSFFVNYRIIKSYLGMARRDLKQISQASTHRDKNKRLAHVVRAYYFVQKILNQHFEPVIEGDFLQEIVQIHQLTDAQKRMELINHWDIKIESLRNLVNQKMDNHSLNIPYYMLPEHQELLDNFIQQIIQERPIIPSKYFQMLKKQLYHVNENGIFY